MNSLLTALKEITGTGRFCSTGNFPFFLPQIFARGQELSFPLCEEQLLSLVSESDKAPFGRGEDTVLDESVRKSWQLDASELKFKSERWATLITKMTTQLTHDLGIEGKVEASPYKLLIYGEGGHFKPHRDTEKLDAMFGTLIVYLPCDYTGGKLLVHHGGQCVEVDFCDPKQRYDFQYAAFFADCEHAVEPIESGYRCCLVYNLALVEGDPEKLNQAMAAHAAMLQPYLDGLREDSPSQPSAVLLDHQYTEANFSLEGLKGHDQSKARALCGAAEQAGFIAHLALVTLHQQGALEGVNYHYSRRRYWEEEDDPHEGEMGEIYEESLGVEHWIDAQGQPASLGYFRLDPEQLLSDAEMTDSEPVEKFGEGPTGNAGCTMDYWYRRAAVLLWPREEDARIRAAANPDAAIEHLKQVAANCPSRQDDFRALALALIGVFAKEGDEHAYGEQPSACLRVLIRAGDSELFSRFIRELDTRHWHALKTDDWESMIQTFDEDAMNLVLERLEANTPENLRTTLFELLCVALNQDDPEGQSRRLLALVSKFPAEAPRQWSWNRPENDDVFELHTLIAGSAIIGDDSVRQTVWDRCHGGARLTHIRERLGPALLLNRIAPNRLQRAEGFFADLRTASIAELQKETDLPLLPYPDWSRPSNETTESRYPALHHFLQNPEEEVWIHGDLKHNRESMADFIRRERLDLDTEMLRKGSPHKIVCRKNDASHQRALARREKDIQLLERLKRLKSGHRDKK